MRDPRNLRMWCTFGMLAAVLFFWRDSLTAEIQSFFAKPDVVSFLLYLETGRVIHAAAEPEETLPPPQTTAPEAAEATAAATEPEKAPEKEPVRLSKADVSAIDIRNSSELAVDGEKLLLTELNWDLEDGEPRVLIFHTHATESYTPTAENPYVESSYYRTLETEDNMVRIGQRLTELLREAGIGTVHDTTFHDYPAYTGSYANARKTLKKHLEQTPSLCLLLDVHRDALETESGKQLATRITVEGRPIARIMLVVGTDAGGLQHPNWQQNLALALKLQRQLESICPGICRYISLRSERFNQDLSPGAVLVEVGTAGNTLEEALAAAEILAQAIAALSKGTVTADSTS